MRIFNLIMVALFISACGTGAPPPQEKGPGSVLTGKDEQGISLSELAGLSGANSTGVGLPINALLWRASLDIIANIPLDDVDTFGGTIVTDWYQISDADERIKISVFVLDRELRADGIRVVVYLQQRVNGDWQDTGTDVELGKKLEELILTRAREIRSQSVAESNN